MTDEQATKQADYTVSQNVSNRKGVIPEASRNLFRAVRAEKCACGSHSLLPGDHATDCAYRVFWEDAARSAFG